MIAESVFRRILICLESLTEIPGSVMASLVVKRWRSAACPRSVLAPTFFRNRSQMAESFISQPEGQTSRKEIKKIFAVLLLRFCWIDRWFQVFVVNVLNVLKTRRNEMNSRNCIKGWINILHFMFEILFFYVMEMMRKAIEAVYIFQF